jgi:hypothetical protein
MKKVILIFLLIPLLSSYQTKEKEVFICPTKSSKVYHLKKDCKGLKRCSIKIKTITEKKAENIGRTMCKIESKK